MPDLEPARSGAEAERRLVPLLDPLFGFISARCPSRDMALDALQDTARATLQAMRVGTTWSEEEKLWSWLIGVARHKIADQFRARGKTPAVGVLGLQADVLLGAMRDARALPPELAARREAASLCRAAVSELAPRQRAALEDYYRRGLGQAQIAERMKVSPKAVESLLARARAELRRVIEQMVAEPEELT